MVLVGTLGSHVYCTLVMSLDGVGGNNELPCLLYVSYVS